MEKPKIIGVYYSNVNETGMMIEIRLQSGPTIYYPLSGKEKDPRFAEIISGKHKGQPKTDGYNIYWGNTARISYDEIVSTLRTGLQPGKIRCVKTEFDYLDEIVIELENDIVIMLSLDVKMNDPLFAEIKELSLPKTDGAQIYWANKASLSASEILSLLLMSNE